MRSPAFQFYPGDWRRNANLQRCTFAARGAWIEVMCLLHDSEVYGVLRWPLKDIARAVGCQPAFLRELIDKGVLKGADVGKTCEAFVYVPRSGRKEGDPVVLVPATLGPIWYSSRMVRDEYVRTVRGASTRFGEGDGDSSKATLKPSPKGGIGEDKGAAPSVRQGDGPASASAFAVKEEKLPTTSGTSVPEPDPIFGGCLAVLISKGVGEKSARSTLGKLRKEIGEAVTIELVAKVESDDISQPVPWLMAAMERRRAAGTRHDQQPEFMRGAL
jgi:hypothetical protein